MHDAINALAKEHQIQLVVTKNTREADIFKAFDQLCLEMYGPYSLDSSLFKSAFTELDSRNRRLADVLGSPPVPLPSPPKTVSFHNIIMFIDEIN